MDHMRPFSIGMQMIRSLCHFQLLLPAPAISFILHSLSLLNFLCVEPKVIHETIHVFPDQIAVNVKDIKIAHTL